jgi:hypothetical protein
MMYSRHSSLAQLFGDDSGRGLMTMVRTWKFVSKAHFVAAVAISMKLGVGIPLGNTPRAFFDFFAI